MKYADVTYTGPMKHHRHKTETGNWYEFNHERPVPVGSVEDAEMFAGLEPFTVEWTIHGQLARQVGDEVGSVSEALSTFGYRQKQSLAKTLGIKANQSEEDLEEELQEEVDSLQEVVENQ